VYRGLYFGIYDSLKPVVLVGPLEVRSLTFSSADDETLWALCGVKFCCCLF
jgi:hypothetical protein